MVIVVQWLGHRVVTPKMTVRIRSVTLTFKFFNNNERIFANFFDIERHLLLHILVHCMGLESTSLYVISRCSWSDDFGFVRIIAV